MKSISSPRISGRFTTQNIHDRLMSLVELVTESGCWIWMSSCHPKGYGMIWFNGMGRTAHRVSYENFVGPIPNGMTIDHLCRVRCCINPAHLEAVSNRTNVLRGIGVTAVNHRKTHCVRGHEFSEENTYHQGGNIRWRQCRACERLRQNGDVAAMKG
jgi:HNH endonuclease